jgi:NADPH2:quinone reductase
MKAWLLDNFSGLGQLRLADVPDPVPNPGEVLLEVLHAALNPADRYLAEGQYPAKPVLPHILGRDGIGKVVRAPDGQTAAAVGERYAVLRGDTGINCPGTFAQFVAVPAEILVEIPPGWTEQEAAGSTLVYLTAYQALSMWGQLPPGTIVLITGASGGVGVAAVQLAVAMNCKVIALSRSAEKGQKLKQLGAAAVFDPADPEWRKAAKASLAPRRVELAIDNIGGKLLPEVIDLLGDQGKVSLVGRLAGPVPNFNTATLFFRRIRLGGVAVGAPSAAESRASWRVILALLASTGARPLVDSVFPFADLLKAFERLAQGPMGKVLLQVNG